MPTAPASSSSVLAVGMGSILLLGLSMRVTAPCGVARKVWVTSMELTVDYHWSRDGDRPDPDEGAGD